MTRVEVFVTADNEVDGSVIAGRLDAAGFDQIEQRTETDGDTVIVIGADLAAVAEALGVLATHSGLTLTQL
jgi:hypothetical protein